MFEQKNISFQKDKKFFNFCGRESKTLLLNSSLHFFKKIEVFRRNIVQIDMFPGGIKKLAKIDKKKVPAGGGEERALSPQKILN